MAPGGSNDRNIQTLGEVLRHFPLYLIGAFAVIIGLAWLYVRVLGENEEDSYLTVISQHLSFDKEGKANTVDTNVLEFVPIRAARRSDLLACIAEF